MTKPICLYERCCNVADHYGIFCGNHHAGHVLMLEELPYTRLKLKLAFRVKPTGGGGGAKSVHPSVPVNMNADALGGEIDDLVKALEYGLYDVGRSSLFAQKCQDIAWHLDRLYTHHEMWYRHWVPADEVADLPDNIEGHVTASGAAIVRERIPKYEGLIRLYEMYKKAKRSS